MRVVRSVLRACKKSSHRFLLFACISIFAAILVMSFVGNGKYERSPREVYTPIDTEQLAPDVLVINTGIYINRIHDVDLSAGTFAANGWL